MGPIPSPGLFEVGCYCRILLIIAMVLHVPTTLFGSVGLLHLLGCTTSLLRQVSMQPRLNFESNEPLTGLRFQRDSRRIIAMVLIGRRTLPHSSSPFSQLQVISPEGPVPSRTERHHGSWVGNCAAAVPLSFPRLPKTAGDRAQAKGMGNGSETAPQRSVRAKWAVYPSVFSDSNGQLDWMGCFFGISTLRCPSSCDHCRCAGWVRCAVRRCSGIMHIASMPADRRHGTP